MKFKCSFAYDVPHYLDFTVEANSERAAKRKINAALRDGAFSGMEDKAEANYENQCHERVFVSGPATHLSTDLTLEQITATTESQT